MMTKKNSPKSEEAAAHIEETRRPSPLNPRQNPQFRTALMRQDSLKAAKKWILMSNLLF